MRWFALTRYNSCFFIRIDAVIVIIWNFWYMVSPGLSSLLNLFLDLVSSIEHVSILSKMSNSRWSYICLLMINLITPSLCHLLLLHSIMEMKFGIIFMEFVDIILNNSTPYTILCFLKTAILHLILMLRVRLCPSGHSIRSSFIHVCKMTVTTSLWCVSIKIGMNLIGSRTPHRWLGNNIKSWFVWDNFRRQKIRLWVTYYKSRWMLHAEVFFIGRFRYHCSVVA